MIFKPTWFIKTYQEITPAFLEKANIATIFADLDNTLVAWDEPTASQALKKWVAQLKKMNIQLILISNNQLQRIATVAEELQVAYVYPGLKPLHKGFKMALQEAQCSKGQIVMVGDQVLTDILGASTFGVRTILVKPLKASDAFKTKINRFFEKGILTLLYGKNYAEKWEDSVHE